MDIVYLQELKVDAVIGIYDWEQRIRQTVSIDLEMAVDVGKAGASDSIDDALNYAAVAERVTEFVEASRFNLIETLAERIAGVLIDELHIGWVKVTLNKLAAVPRVRGVGVVIERGTRE